MRTGWASALKNSALNTWSSGEAPATRLTNIRILKYSQASLSGAPVARGAPFSVLEARRQRGTGARVLVLEVAERLAAPGPGDGGGPGGQVRIRVLDVAEA